MDRMDFCVQGASKKSCFLSSLINSLIVVCYWSTGRQRDKDG